MKRRGLIYALLAALLFSSSFSAVGAIVMAAPVANQFVVEIQFHCHDNGEAQTVKAMDCCKSGQCQHCMVSPASLRPELLALTQQHTSERFVLYTSSLQSLALPGLYRPPILI